MAEDVVAAEAPEDGSDCDWVRASPLHGHDAGSGDPEAAVFAYLEVFYPAVAEGLANDDGMFVLVEGPAGDGDSSAGRSDIEGAGREFKVDARGRSDGLELEVGLTGAGWNVQSVVGCQSFGRDFSATEWSEDGPT